MPNRKPATVTVQYDMLHMAKLWLSHSTINVPAVSWHAPMETSGMNMSAPLVITHCRLSQLYCTVYVGPRRLCKKELKADL